MPDFSQLADNLQKKSVDENKAPLTTLLDEFLKEQVVGSKENIEVANMLNSTKEERDKNGRFYPNYKNYDGREALSQIEKSPKPEVTVHERDRYGRPTSLSTDMRALKVSYSPDGMVERITAVSKVAPNKSFWSESELTTFERLGQHEYQGFTNDNGDKTRAAFRPDLYNVTVEPNGDISYHYRLSHRVTISMDNSVSYEREDLDGVSGKRETLTYRRDGSQRVEVIYPDQTKLTIEGTPATIFQDVESVYGFNGVAPKAALLENPTGGKLVFLPNRDGTYLRAAFDPQGNLSSDVIFNKPLPRFIDDLRNSQSLSLSWSPYDKNGVHFTMNGIKYGVMDNIDYYLDFKRDKGR